MSKNKRVSALLNLLQDDNVKIASLAMEELLKLGRITDETIAEYQEAQDPKLRYRIHQLSGILARRRGRIAFIKAMKKDTLSLWDGVLDLNRLYDPRVNLDGVDKKIKVMAEKLPSGQTTGPQLAALMRDEEIAVPDEDVHDIDLYLIERVLNTRYGAPAVLCALAQRVGTMAGFTPAIVLYSGRFCLMDGNHLLLDPGEGWRLTKLKDEERIHPCGRKNVILGILTQMFLIALLEGQLRDLYHFGDLLTALNATTCEHLPFPLGESH